jgi:hypothetical protein
MRSDGKKREQEDLLPSSSVARKGWWREGGEVARSEV